MTCVLGDVLAGAREATTPTDQDSGNDVPSAAGGVGAEGDVAERAGRLLLKTLESADGLQQLSAAHEAVSAYHGNYYLPLLEGFYRSHRPALFTQVDDTHDSADAERPITELIGLCQGFPLALGLIAARIRTHSDLLDDLVDDLRATYSDYIEQ